MLSHLVCVEHYDSRNFELSNSISSSAVNVLQSSSPEVLHTNSMLSCNGVPIKILTFTSKPTKRFVKPGQYNSWTRFFSLARRHLTIDKTWCSSWSSCWIGTWSCVRTMEPTKRTHCALKGISHSIPYSVPGFIVTPQAIWSVTQQKQNEYLENYLHRYMWLSITHFSTEKEQIFDHLPSQLPKND